MFRDDLEAAHARARAIEQELAEAKDEEREDQATIDALQAKVDEQQAEIERLRDKLGDEPDLGQFDALVVRGEHDLAKKELNKQVALARTKSKELLRERRSMSPLGHLLTPLATFQGVVAGLMLPAILIADPTSLVLGYVAAAASFVGLGVAASIMTRVRHSQAKQWSEELPFKNNYPQCLGPKMNTAVVGLRFEGKHPSHRELNAAIDGLSKNYLEVVSAGNGAARIRIEGDYTTNSNSALNRRFRWLVRTLLLPLHADYPLSEVRMDKD
jgi:hypothetical protein